MGEREICVFGPVLKTLIEAGKNVRSNDDLTSLLHSIMDGAGRLFDAEAASLGLIDEKEGTLFFRTATGKKGGDVEGVHLAMGEGVAGLVAKEGKSMIVNKPDKDRRHALLLASLFEFTPRNILCVPLKHGGRTIGVLEVLNKKGGGFTGDDLATLEVLAEKLAPVIIHAKAAVDGNA